MTRDETVALFLECEAKRAEALAAALAEGKNEIEAEGIAHEAAKTHWNAWAVVLLDERQALEVGDQSAVGAQAEGHESSKEDSLLWLSKAAIDFSYCSFLPSEGSKPVTEDLNTKTTDTRLIAKAIHLVNSRARLDGYIFPGSVNFSNAQFSCPSFFRETTFSLNADFQSAAFDSEANFERSSVSGNIDCRGTKFSSQASFVGATFSANADFSGAIFSDNAHFRNAFFGNAYFNGTTFAGSTYFTNVSYSGSVHFEKVSFSSDASFASSSFSQDASFREANFGGGTTFEKVTFSGDTTFKSAKFTNEADFSGALFVGDAELGGALFSGNANFKRVKFSGNAVFSRVEFKQAAIFERAILGNDSASIYFDRAKFRETADFYNFYAEGNCDFLQATFDDFATFENAKFMKSEVPPLSWTPKHLCFRSPQCRRNVPHTRLSSGGR